MNKQVEIFKTNVVAKEDAAAVTKKLVLHFPHCTINFDLEDCDRILRIEASNEKINEQEIIQFIHKQGFACIHIF